MPITIPHRRHTILVFFSVALFAMPARGSLLTRLCDILLGITGTNSSKSVSKKWLRDPKLTAKLKTLLAAHLEDIRPGAEKFLGALTPGSLLEVNGVKYTLLAYLGGELEGSVYLAQGVEGKRSIKLFNGRTEILGHYQQLDQLKQKGLPTPRVWIVDPKTNTAVMEYIEGVPVNVLFKKGTQFGLSKKELEEIRVRYDEFKQIAIRLGAKMTEGNVIMDLNTGEFVIVDAI